MTQFFKRFAQDESGATAFEYGLIASLFSITIISASTNIGGSDSSKYKKVESSMTCSSSDTAVY